MTPKKQAPEPPIEAQPLPDPAAYDIAFVRDDFPEYDKMPVHVQRANIYLTYCVVVTVLSLIGVLTLVTQTLAFGFQVYVVAALALLFVVVVVLMRRDFKSTFEKGVPIHRKLPYESLKANRRIHICVRPKFALELLRSLPDANLGFEPEVARVPLALGIDSHTRRLAFLGGTLGLAGAAIGLTIFGWDRVHFGVMFWFVIGMCVLGSVVLPEFFYPTYVRVVPGRVDVIRAPLILSSMHIMQSFDLRGRPLVINEFALFVEPEREPGTPRPAKVWGKKWSQGMVHPPECNPEAISLAMTLGRKRLIRAIVLASVTEVPNPMVPTDRLIG